MGMLIGQGIKAVEIWLDTSLSKDSWQLMSKAAYNHK
jgi:shikimate 5-dehydrogenase